VGGGEVGAVGVLATGGGVVAVSSVFVGGVVTVVSVGVTATGAAVVLGACALGSWVESVVTSVTGGAGLGGTAVGAVIGVATVEAGTTAAAFVGAASLGAFGFLGARRRARAAARCTGRAEEETVTG
jgi:hypothetical protein